MLRDGAVIRASSLRIALTLAVVLSLALAPQALGFGQVPGSPFASEETAKETSQPLAFSESGKLLAIANKAKNTVSIYSVNASTGALTQVSGSPFAAGTEPLALAFSRGSSAHLLAVTSFDRKLSIFNVNESTGAVSPVTGSPFPVGEDPDAVAFNPAYEFIAVANGGIGSNSVSIFHLNGITHNWEESGTFPAGGQVPSSVSWSVRGEVLAVANLFSENLSIFKLNGSGIGTLHSYPLGKFPSGAAFSPSGNLNGADLLAVTNQGSNNVSMFGVNEAKAEAFAVEGSPFAAGSGPSAATFSGSGGELAVANESGNSVSLYSVNQASGVLTQVPESPFAAGSKPVGAAFSPAGEAGLLAVAHNGEKDISVFASAHPPSVTGVSPNTGSTAGGTSVTITGSNFLGTSAVKFGSTSAKSFTVNSPTSITAVSPAVSSPGRVDVTVTSPGGSAAGGTSATNGADLFRYVPAGPPELGDCREVAKGTGAYADAGCTKKIKKGGGFQWKGLTGFGPLFESEARTAFVLETASKAKLECQGFFFGQYDGPKALNFAAFLLESCASGCKNGASAGIGSYELEGAYGVETAVRPPKIALDLYPLRRSGPLFEYECGTVKRTVRGAVISSVTPTDKMSESFTVSWAASKGKQKPEKLVGGPKEGLETSTNGGPWEKTTMTFTTTVGSFAEPLEINATL